MYCPQCGRENEDSAQYCAFCGESLAPAPAANVTATPQTEPMREPVAPTPQQPTPPAYGAPAGSGPYGTASYGDPSGAYQQPPQTPPYQAPQTPPSQPPQTPPYQSAVPTQPPMAAYPPSAVQEGCFSAAWRDLTSSPGWFKRTVLLGLINAVPILNFSVEGYAMDWGREVAYERREAMPEHFFGHRTMLLGLCLTVFSLLMGIFMVACSLAASALVPFLGAIAAIVFCVFTSMFTYTGLIRMGVFGKFGAAFDLVADWRAFRRRLGTLFCASFLPSIIIGLITYAIIFVLLSIVLAVMGAGVSNVLQGYGYGYGYGYSFDINDVGALIGGLGGMTVGLVLLFLVCWFIAAIGNTLIKLVTYRALGHWALRIAPEWRAEALEEQKIYGVDFPAGPMLEEIRRGL